MATATRSLSLGSAVRYRGREGMWTWILHRVTGLGVLFFLMLHIAETATVIYWPDFYDTLLDGYKTPLFRLAELVIFFSVLYHALNGLRIVVQDFWPRAMRFQRQLVWTVAAVTALGMVPVTWIMLAPMFGLAEEPGVERHRERCLERPDAPACLEAAAGGGEVML